MSGIGASKVPQALSLLLIGGVGLNPTCHNVCALTSNYGIATSGESIGLKLLDGLGEPNFVTFSVRAASRTC